MANTPDLEDEDEKNEFLNIDLWGSEEKPPLSGDLEADNGSKTTKRAVTKIAKKWRKTIVMGV